MAQVEDEDVMSGARLIEQFQTVFDPSHCRALIGTWLGRGANLALAGKFTQQCAQTAEEFLKSSVEGTDHALEKSKLLFINSGKPLPTSPSTGLDTFSSRFTGREARWETLGIFFTAISRAANDIGNFEPLYQTRQERRRHQKLALRFSDSCLDVAISLDCLNDLQLVLQYENFILHSFVNGDQSKSLLPAGRYSVL